MDERFGVEVAVPFFRRRAAMPQEDPTGSSIGPGEILGEKGPLRPGRKKLGTEQLPRVVKMARSLQNLQKSVTQMGCLIEAELYYSCCLSK